MFFRLKPKPKPAVTDPTLAWQTSNLADLYGAGTDPNGADYDVDDEPTAFDN